MITCASATIAAGDCRTSSVYDRNMPAFTIRPGMSLAERRNSSPNAHARDPITRRPRVLDQPLAQYKLKQYGLPAVETALQPLLCATGSTFIEGHLVRRTGSVPVRRASGR